MLRPLCVLAVLLVLAACGGGGASGSPSSSTSGAGGSSSSGMGGGSSSSSSGGGNGTIASVTVAPLDFTGGPATVTATLATGIPGASVSAWVEALAQQTTLTAGASAWTGTLDLPGNADPSGVAKTWPVQVILTANGQELDRVSATARVEAPPSPPALP